MNTFKQFGITVAKQAVFTGAKITVGKVLNKEIVINGFRIMPSKFNGDRLDLDIILNEEKRLLWTGRKSLIESMKQVPADGLPLTATIILENEIYQFS